MMNRRNFLALAASSAAVAAAGIPAIESVATQLEKQVGLLNFSIGSNSKAISTHITEVGNGWFRIDQLIEAQDESPTTVTLSVSDIYKSEMPVGPHINKGKRYTCSAHYKADLGDGCHLIDSVSMQETEQPTQYVSAHNFVKNSG